MTESELEGEPVLEMNLIRCPGCAHVFQDDDHCVADADGQTVEIDCPACNETFMAWCDVVVHYYSVRKKKIKEE